MAEQAVCFMTPGPLLRVCAVSLEKATGKVGTAQTFLLCLQRMYDAWLVKCIVALRGLGFLCTLRKKNKK